MYSTQKKDNGPAFEMTYCAIGIDWQVNTLANDFSRSQLGLIVITGRIKALTSFEGGRLGRPRSFAWRTSCFGTTTRTGLRSLRGIGGTIQIHAGNMTSGLMARGLNPFVGGHLSDV